MAVTINLPTITVNTLNRDAAIVVGENNLPAWCSHGKNTFGNGMLFGNVAMFNVFNIVNDNDVIDAPINDQDSTPAVQNQQL